jgi:hypothetical protein
VQLVRRVLGLGGEAEHLVRGRDRARVRVRLS